MDEGPSQPHDPAADGLARALEDVTSELRMVETARGPDEGDQDDSLQDWPELGYYEAALHSLRSALERELRAHE